MSREADTSERFGTIPSIYPSVANVIVVYRAARELQVERGVSWYANEHDFARSLADTHWRRSGPRTVDIACAILAALSPMVPWEYAKQLALQCYREGSLHSGHFSTVTDKVNAIYSGWPPQDVLSGPKVRSFYEALRTGGNDADVVVVDRHAIHVSVGAILDQRDRGRLLRVTTSVDGYENAAHTYRNATRHINAESELELTPSQVQAITWVTWRDWLLGEGGETR